MAPSQLRGSVVPKGAAGVWSAGDLTANSISINTISKPEKFFGRDPATTEKLLTVDPALLSTDVSSLVSMVGKLKESTFDALTNLTWAMHAVAGEEPAITDFGADVFKILGYVQPQTKIKNKHSLPFNPCRAGKVDADITIVTDAGMILLVFVAAAVDGADPEASVIAAAIAAYQENNRLRATRNLGPLDEVTMPGITMVGTKMSFYLVPVTKQLSDNLKEGGGRPGKKTVVTKCAVAGKGPGMQDVKFRRLSLSHCAAFKKVADATSKVLL